MKRIFKSFLYVCAFAALTMPFAGCSDDDTEGAGDTGISNLNNPREGKEITKYGETITVTFNAASGWDADITMASEEKWATISRKTGTEGGSASMQITFSKNNTTEPRSCELWVAVSGKTRTKLCTFTQTAGDNIADMSRELNKKMDDILKEEYLWRDAYNELTIDYTTPYDEFLFNHLTQLGETNIEDGGYRRESDSEKGQRYIYSQLVEVTAGGSSSQKERLSDGPATRVRTRYGLGIGPMNAHYYAESKPGLTIGFVETGSPAEKAGLKRGDMIYKVNGIELDRSNYYPYMVELYNNPTGTYKLTYSRIEIVEGEALRIMGNEATVSMGSWNYNPVLSVGIIPPEATGKEGCTIGCLVLQSFDADGQAYLESALNELKKNNITDLILDLRFNIGGSVAQSRYLASALAGRAHDDDVFVNCTFVTGKVEPWTFGTGYLSQPDNLGKGPDLGLKRLFVICSSYTASASELIINGLRGIDMPVYLYGARTEGKNVGMTIKMLSYNNRHFEFAPITFRSANAQGFGDYPDGFPVEYMVNNQNGQLTDDIEAYYPYTDFDWEEFSRDAVNFWAFCHITGKELPVEFKEAQAEQGQVSPEPLYEHRRTIKTAKKATYVAPRLVDNPSSLKQLPMKLIPGQFGSVIDRTEE